MPEIGQTTTRRGRRQTGNREKRGRKKKRGDGLIIVPCTREEANAYVEKLHRTHVPTWNSRACFGVVLCGKLIGVCMIGRPVNIQLDQSEVPTAEVVRCCTDGTFNAASKLYSNAWVCAKALGYQRLITYTLPYEGGPCLRALKQQGWKRVEDEEGNVLLLAGGTWDHPNNPERRRVDKHPIIQKWRWEVMIEGAGSSVLWDGKEVPLFSDNGE